MADETTDSSNREQVVICFRWVDNSLNAHDEFIGRQQVDRIDAATIYITFTIKDVLQRMNRVIGYWIIAVTEMKARIRGVQVYMHHFEFIFGLVLGRNLLQLTDSLRVCVCKENCFL